MCVSKASFSFCSVFLQPWHCSVGCTSVSSLNGIRYRLLSLRYELRVPPARCINVGFAKCSNLPVLASRRSTAAMSAHSSATAGLWLNYSPTDVAQNHYKTRQNPKTTGAETGRQPRWRPSCTLFRNGKVDEYAAILMLTKLAPTCRHTILLISHNQGVRNK